ncbi:MAG: hypothetical protein RBT76_10520 [candidate division Zixibacteria bacterium]|jgi:hypothetical protein|nr:hypothetical protein [candidate division Zixibacteria bacterium]
MRLKMTILLGALIASAAGVALADNSGRIYGRVLLADGDELEGLIRWDKNEANWVDMLNGTKELSERDQRRARDEERTERRGEIRFFGIRIGESSDWSSSASSGIRFGHIRSVEAMGDDRALVTLKSGREVELTGSSTDLGSGMRDFVIEDNDGGEVELVWDDIEKIEFMAARTDQRSRFGDRLYGTLQTRRGETFTGFICWDIDELFTSDILDGEENNRSRKIPFDKIQAIERYSSSAARVYLTGGDEVILRGTNDVDDDNRGIVVSDPGFGDVIVSWGEFDRVDFSTPTKQIGYDDFDGGRPLQGTVYTDAGDRHTGTIRWDNDEEYTWEIIDGEYRDVEYDIELGAIKEIRRRGRSGAIVTVLDGREFQLRDSNDIDDSNKGIFITTSDGDEVVVDWEEFDRVVFDHK